MGLKNWAAKKLLGSVIEAEVQKRIAASVTSDNDKGWRKLTEDPNRKLPMVDQDRMFEISYWLWKNNPLAHWIIEIMTAFVVGDGVKIEAGNKDLKKLLDDFWKDPVNCMDIYLEKYTRELGIYGEQCWPKFTSQNAGKVRLGYIDPQQINKVVTDPENVKMIIGIILKGPSMEEGKKYKTVLPEEAEEILSNKAKGLREEYKDGECYFFAINNVTNDPRGTSDIFVLADWLDAYEQFLFDYTDKWPLLNAFVWDLLIKNADEKKLTEELNKFTKKSGSVYAHNENITLEAKNPKLQAVEADAGARLLRNHILGNKSLPEHWYGGGGDVNRATALEMGAPAFKMMSSRQKLVIYILEFILADVVRTAEAKGMLKGVPEEEREFKIVTPELASKDISKFSTAIQQITSSLVQANVNEWIDQETAVKIFAFALSLIGYELDVEAIREKLEEEADKKGYEDYGDGKDKNPGTAL